MESEAVRAEEGVGRLLKIKGKKSCWLCGATRRRTTRAGWFGINLPTERG